MWFEQLLREETGCATYLVGSSEVDRCAVFDPLWAIEPYLELAERRGSEIVFVIDSHAHADHVSGARRLVAATGAELLLPEHMEASYPARRLRDGERLVLGEVELEVMHVPGHRPELIALLVRDTLRGAAPWCMLSADFLLVGDVARPDLAQDGPEGARTLFTRSIPRLLALPDFVEAYPGHVAGSTCGRVSSGKAVTTVGYERRFNPALQLDALERFVDYMVRDQPARPANMENIVAINQGRREYTMGEPSVPRMTVEDVRGWVDAGRPILDTRDAHAFGRAHVPGAWHVDLSNPAFEQRAGWILPPEGDYLLVVETAADAARAAHKLAFVGLDRRARGYIEQKAWSDAGLPQVELPRTDPRTVAARAARGAGAVLDVRERDEWSAGHIEGAVQTSYRLLPSALERLPLRRDAAVAVVCEGGGRASLAASLLQSRGFTRVEVVEGGMHAWREAGLPVNRG